MLFTDPVSAQEPVPAQRIDSLVAAYDDAGPFNGAVLVGQDHSVACARAVGDANMKWDVAHTTDTRFHIGSMTKQFTATLILTFVEEDKVALDSTISTYLPDYPRPGADRITIHHLLSHRSGIPSFTGFEDYRSRIMRREWEPDSLYDAMTTVRSDNGYGYGLVLRSDTTAGTPVSVTGPGGGINGFTSSLNYTTPGDSTVIALDTTGSEQTGRLTGGIRQVLFGGFPPPPQSPVARVLCDVFHDRSVADATAR